MPAELTVWAVVCADEQIHGVDSEDPWVQFRKRPDPEVVAGLDRIAPGFAACGPHRVAEMREVGR